MQWIPVLSQVEDEIVNCFNNGGGVPYSSYKRFHEVMAEESYQTVVVALFDHILPLVPNLTDKLKKGINVLDIGCGKGRAINVMANHFKNSNSIDMIYPEKLLMMPKEKCKGWKIQMHSLRFKIS